MNSGRERPRAIRGADLPSAAGALFGGLTLVFLMYIVARGDSVPLGNKFLVISIVSLGVALSFSFIGGSAAAKGKIPFSFAQDHSIEFSVAGGLAAFVITALIGNEIYSPASNPHDFPPKFSDLTSADLQVSQVDDVMMVKINNHEAIKAVYGQTSPWIPVKDLLHRGANSIEIQIMNGQFGGCGGKLVFRFNGEESPGHSWSWFKELGAPENGVCFSQYNTLNIE